MKKTALIPIEVDDNDPGLCGDHCEGHDIIIGWCNYFCIDDEMVELEPEQDGVYLDKYRRCPACIEATQAADGSELYEITTGSNGEIRKKEKK